MPTPTTPAKPTPPAPTTPAKPTPSTPKAGVKGRHDACVAVRAVPVVEAMTALALVQFL